MFAACPLLAAGGAYFQNSGQQVVVGNSQIELAFSSTNGGLLNLVDKATGQDFLVQKNAFWNGFTFSYITPGNNTVQYANGALAQSVTFTPATTSTGIQVKIQFNKFVANSSALNVSATLIVSADNISPLTTLQLSVANRDRITIEAVDLPYLTGLGQMSTGPDKDYLAFPSFSGLLFQDPVHSFIPGRGWGWQLYYASGFENVQFPAYFGGESGAGLYIASQDTAGYTKYLNSSRASDVWLEIGCFYVPTFQAGASATVPYPAVVGVFHGDWFDAASLYRVWAVQQQWAQGGPLATRTDVPDWYKNTGMMAYKQTFTEFTADHQSYASLAPVAAAWRQQLQSPPLINWISWENQGAWMDSPDFLPPSQGWAAFDSAVSATHAAGGRLMVEPTTNDATEGAPSGSLLRTPSARSGSCR